MLPAVKQRITLPLKSEQERGYDLLEREIEFAMRYLVIGRSYSLIPVPLGPGTE